MSKLKYSLLEEHKDFLCVDKPSGMLCAADRQGQSGLREFLQKKYGEVFLTHRIDRETSGIMIFARNPETHKALSTQFERHEIQKKYLALVMGAAQVQTISLPLLTKKIGSHHKALVDRSKGKPAETIITDVEILGPYSLIRCQITSGRMHQIRAHLSAIHHPLVGDDRYDGPSSFYLSSIKKLNNRQSEKPLLDRVALHAEHLSFTLNNASYQYTSTPPKDIRATLQQLRKRFN